MKDKIDQFQRDTELEQAQVMLTLCQAHNVSASVAETEINGRHHVCVVIPSTHFDAFETALKKALVPIEKGE